MTAPDAGTPDPADELAQFAEASKSPEDFWLVYRTLMARYDSSCRVAHMTAFADEVAALAVSALAATGRLLPADAETRTEYGVRMAETSGGSSTSSGAEYGRPTRENAESSAAFMRTLPGVASTEVVWRTTWVGPWLPAPTDTEES